MSPMRRYYEKTSMTSLQQALRRHERECERRCSNANVAVRARWTLLGFFIGSFYGGLVAASGMTPMSIFELATSWLPW